MSKNRKIYKISDYLDRYLRYKQISDEVLYWKGKALRFTRHFRKEFEEFKKPQIFILEILDKGMHILVSKRKQKYNVFYPYKGKSICLSYAVVDDMLLIHIKPTRRK